MASDRQGRRHAAAGGAGTGPGRGDAAPGVAEPADATGDAAERALLAELDAAADTTVALRRAFHRIPELGWCEYRTTALLVERLTAWGMRPRIGAANFVDDLRQGLPDAASDARGVDEARAAGVPADLLAAMRGGHTGGVLEIRGGQPGATVGFRVDIDALPIAESDAPDHRPHREGFVSTRPGTMHACGHDGHMAIGLTLARLIHGNRARWPGTAIFVFQPAEEGGRGARAMVPTGVVDGCDAMLTWHLAGCGGRFGHVVGGASGFAITRKFRAVFTGRAAHAGAEPQLGRNALLAAASATLNLHAISRHAGAETRVNVGRLDAPGAHNIVPAHAELHFELRADEEAALDFMEERAREILTGAAAMQGVAVALSGTDIVPSATSDRALVDLIGEVCADLDAVSGFTPYFKDPGSDDATFLMRRVQARGGVATYALIGAALASGLHTPRFDFDERALTIAAKVLALTAHRLGRRSPAAPGAAAGRA